MPRRIVDCDRQFRHCERLPSPPRRRADRRAILYSAFRANGSIDKRPLSHRASRHRSYPLPRQNRRGLPQRPLRRWQFYSRARSTSARARRQGRRILEFLLKHAGGRGWPPILETARSNCIWRRCARNRESKSNRPWSAPMPARPVCRRERLKQESKPVARDMQLAQAALP